MIGDTSLYGRPYPTETIPIMIGNLSGFCPFITSPAPESPFDGCLNLNDTADI